MADQVDFEVVLREAVKIPLVHINREAYLRKELSRRFDTETVNKAIEYNPAYAGISAKQLESIAQSAIDFETTKVTALSFAAGIPGGFAMAGTIPADLAQYMAHVLRITQKLAYLYGWPSLSNTDGEKFDDETSRVLTLFTGVMFGVQGANAAITKLASRIAEQVSKKLAQKALTNGIVYPIVKKVAITLGFQMTKQIFARGVAKVIPVVGGVASGGLTFITYKPMAERLKNHLSGLQIANVSYYEDTFVEDISEDDIH